MLKVKKKINKNKNKNQEDDITKAQSDLKYSIKDLYIDSQKKKLQRIMFNLLQKLEKNMLNYNKKITN